MSRRYSVGVVTAYGAAKAGGYTGTYSQFCEDLADLGDNIAEIREARIEVDANKTAAQQAQEGAETAQGAAEDAAESVSQSAAQIEQNREDIDDLKSAINAGINGMKKYHGFSLFENAPYNFILAVNSIIDCYVQGDITPFVGLRLSRLVNTGNYSHQFRLLDSAGNMFQGIYNEDGYNVLTIGASVLSVKFDWNRVISIVNISYNESYAEISAENTVWSDVKSLAGKEADNRNEIKSVTDTLGTFNLTSIITGAPVNQDNVYKNIVSCYGDNITNFVGFKICTILNNSSYPHTVRLIDSENTRYFSNYNEISGINTFVVKGQALYVKIDWDNLPVNGLNVNTFAESYIEIVNANKNNLVNYFGVGFNPNVLQTPASVYDGSLINAQGGLYHTTTNSWHARKYQVIAGKSYNIIGCDVRIAYNYPLVGFSTENYDGETTITTQIIIGASETNIEHDYNVTFIAPNNGYLYVINSHNYYTLTVFESAYGSELIDKLTGRNGSQLKIQLFGDSITDDSWRADHITWATLFPYYLPAEKWNVINSAVGGSHIGHGKVTPPGTKYPELEYNYVYDLITNPEIFDDKCDFYIVFSGANDFNSGDVGQWGDSTVDTFYGALKLIIEYVTRNTTSTLLVCTPMCRYTSTDEERNVNADGEPINSRGQSLREFAEAVIKTCEFYEIPYIDLFHDLGFNRDNIRKYTAEGLHPNLLGSHKICAYIASKVKEHIINPNIVPDRNYLP